MLASASPRRAALLRAFGLSFDTVPADVDERALPGEEPRAQALRLARDKARAVARGRAEGVVLGADTLIDLDGRALGKPADLAEARAMLSSLAGREHRVHSAVALQHAPSGRVASECASARVAFAPLAQGWLAGYLAGGEWEGKAGAYAIQGAGASFIALRSGTLDTVIGLPCALVASLAARLAREVST